MIKCFPVHCHHFLLRYTCCVGPGVIVDLADETISSFRLILKPNQKAAVVGCVDGPTFMLKIDNNFPVANRVLDFAFPLPLHACTFWFGGVIMHPSFVTGERVWSNWEMRTHVAFWSSFSSFRTQRDDNFWRPTGFWWLIGHIHSWHQILSKFEALWNVDFLR